MKFIPLIKDLLWHLGLGSLDRPSEGQMDMDGVGMPLQVIKLCYFEYYDYPNDIIIRFFRCDPNNEDDEDQYMDMQYFWRCKDVIYKLIHR